MGLFQHKQSKSLSIEDAAKIEQHFFDETFREELRNHGRLYFEKIINDNGILFKQDLDATLTQVTTDLKDHITQKLDDTITEVNAEVKQHVTKQLEDRFAEYGKEMKDAQTATLESLSRTSDELQMQYRQLSETVKKNIETQDTTLTTASKENIDRMTEMKGAQDSALDILNKSVQSLQEQSQQLRTMLQKNIVDQEAMLVGAFQDNMAQIIEHYLLGALGDQFDLKAQLPAIIQQMEENKQAISDDMKL